MPDHPYTFFLGGHDLEMLAIRELLEQHGVPFHDKNLRWGAKASAYRNEIQAALEAGRIPVLVELENDLDLPVQTAHQKSEVRSQRSETDTRALERLSTSASQKPKTQHPKPAPTLVSAHPDPAQPQTAGLPASSLHHPTAPSHHPPTPPTLHPPILLLDHHGDRAGSDQPTSLHQTCRLLELPPSAWTRWHELVAANDRAHIKGMLAIGASPDEIQQIRAADRAAQGVTPDDEAAARRAIAEREELADGRLTLLRLPTHRTSAAADLMETALGGPGFQNLLILSPNELNFFGDGTLVLVLRDAFPKSWSGGDLPARGFWGASHSNADPDAVLKLLRRKLQEIAE